MNARELRKIMKPTTRKSKKLFVKEYIENTDSVTLKYYFRGQKESNLTIPNTIWNKMKFENTEEGVEITKVADLKIITNKDNWSRLSLPETAEEDE